jgi:hypothetical protein
VPPVTDTLNVKLVPEATLSLFTVNFVTVAVFVGGGVVPLPLHPIVKLSMQMRLSPSAARYFLRPPGTKSRKSAAKPVPALRAHHPLLPALSGVDFASSIRSSRTLEAVRDVDVAVTARASIPVALPFAGGVIAAGAVQVTPGGKVVGQATVTAELKPLTEVTVIVEFTLAPVAELKVTGVEATVNVPAALTVTVAFPAPEDAEPL